MVAIVPKSFSGATGQRWRALLWRTPSQTWTLNAPYEVNPDNLTAALPLPRGGEPYTGVIEALTLKYAEIDKHEGPGKLAAEADKALLAAIQRDGGTQPRSLGKDPQYGRWRESEQVIGRIHDEYLGT